MELLLYLITILSGFAFLLLCYRAYMYVKERWGQAWAIVFILAVLFYSCGRNSNTENKTHEPKQWDLASTDSLNKNTGRMMSTELQKTMLTKLTMLIKYCESATDRHKVATSASFMQSGIGGIKDLEPVDVYVNETARKNTIEYFVHAVINWKLLGCVIYVQAKEYHGFINLE